MRRGVALAIGATLYSKGAAALVQLIMVPALAVHWGLALYGQWLMLMAVPFFFATSDLGFVTAAGNRLIGEAARGDFDDARLTFRSARRLVALLTGGIFALGSLAVVLLPGHLLQVAGGMDAATAKQAVICLLLYSLLTLNAQLYICVATAAGRQAQAIALFATTQIVEGAAVLASVAAGGGPGSVAIVYAVMGLVYFGSQLIHAHRHAPWLRGVHVDGAGRRLRELLRPALAAMVIPLSQAAYMQGTVIALGAAAGSATVPLYTSLRTICRIALQLASTLAIPLAPVFTAAHAQANARRMARTAGVLLVATLAISIPLGVIVAVFGQPLMSAWTAGAIRPPQPLVIAMGLSLVFAVVWGALSFLLLGANRHEAFATAYMPLSLMAVAATYLLAGQFGVFGTALANLALEIAMTVIVVVSLRRLVGRFEFGRDAFLAILPEHWRGRFGKGAMP